MSSSRRSVLASAVGGMLAVLYLACAPPAAQVNEKEIAVTEPSHPLAAMAPWEKELWESHVGTWRSHYTIRDGAGNIVDEHDAINDIALDLERNIYSQRNTYTRGDEVEVRRYSASWEGREMIIRGEVLEGRASAHDPRTIVLHFAKPSLGEETYETIVTMDGVHRGRSMQHYEGGVLKRVTSVFGEVKISDRPGIDADGNDRPDRGGG